MKYPLHISRNSIALLLPIALGLAIPTATPAATVILSPSEGQGADAYTDANQVDTAFGATDPDRLLVRRANTKTYLRYDLAALGGLSALGQITAVELRMDQIGDPLRLDEDMEVFGINLNYDFSTDGRLGVDWDPAVLTHANAPASGAGGSVSTANSRAILFGTMAQSLDGVLYSYAEDDSMMETPLLDYLNASSSYSSTETELRALIVAEAPDQARNTKIFPSSDSGTSGFPVLVITYEEIPPTVVLNPSQGQGADAYTDANQVDTAFGVTDPDRLLVRRANTKTYLRYDLAALGGLSALGQITAVELRMEQNGDPIRLDEDMEVFGINLNYDFAADGRLGVDWDPAALTHANAPASGAGGSVSTSDSRAILFGTMAQSPDGVRYSYAEDDSLAETPMLDYLKGISGFSSTETEFRALIIAEAPSQAGNTKIFPSSESSTAGYPVLVLTYESGSVGEVLLGPVTLDGQGGMVVEYRASPKGMTISFEKSTDLQGWATANPLLPPELLESGPDFEVWQAVFETPSTPGIAWNQFIRASY